MSSKEEYCANLEAAIDTLIEGFEDFCGNPEPSDSDHDKVIDLWKEAARWSRRAGLGEPPPLVGANLRFCSGKGHMGPFSRDKLADDRWKDQLRALQQKARDAQTVSDEPGRAGKTANASALAQGEGAGVDMGTRANANQSGSGQGVDTGTGKTNGAGLQSTSPRPRSPSDTDLIIYRYQFATGKSQMAMANDPVLMDQLGKPVSQGSISRSLTKVKKWIKSGNVLPNPGNDHERRQQAIDPSRIDLGERQDGRTERQRGRRSDDD